MASQRLEQLQHIAGVARLRQEMVKADDPRKKLVRVLRIDAADGDQKNVAVAGADGSRDVVPGDDRHVDVDDDCMRSEFPRGPQHLTPGVHTAYVVPLVTQHHLERQDGIAVIVGDKHPQRAHPLGWSDRLAWAWRYLGHGSVIVSQPDRRVCRRQKARGVIDFLQGSEIDLQLRSRYDPRAVTGRAHDAVGKATKRALLRKAADLVGEDQLAARLRVPVSLLDVWLRGLATMPDRKLLMLADLLEELADRKK